MKARSYVLLFLAGLLIPLAVAQFQPFPGYLDSDYYFASGLQLVRGDGFTEPYIWNYLEDPPGLPHASHGYWMPLASMVAAASMWLFGDASYASARLIFILIAAFVPPLTAALAYDLGRRSDLALTSGVLAVFSVFHAPFLPVTDNFGISMLLGCCYLLVAGRPRPWFSLGLLAGLLTLSRTDGLLWVLVTVALALSPWPSPSGTRTGASRLAPALVGFLIIMTPWYLRNLEAFGAFAAPGSSKVLWLQEYDQIFAFPSARITAAEWLRSGWPAILADRLWALGQNLQSAVAAQGAIVLFPFIVMGIWNRRSLPRVRIAVLAWIALFAAMTVLVPFAGARGGFFHAGAAFQPLWWALAPLGLEIAVSAARSRGWFTRHAHVVFRLALLQVVVLLTFYVVWLRIFSLGWGEGEAVYPRVEALLSEHGIQSGDVVIVRNPPGYYLATGRMAIAIPYGGVDTILAVSDRYRARFLVLEPQAVLEPLREIYEQPAKLPRFDYLGEIEKVRIYELSPH